MTTLVERLRRRADELEAMIDQPQAETAAAWAVQAHCCMGKARLDHLACIAEIERLEKALETAREDREQMHRRAQVAEGAAQACLGIVDDWLPLCTRYGLNGHDIMLRAVKCDISKAVAKFRALSQKKEG